MEPLQLNLSHDPVVSKKEKRKLADVDADLAQDEGKKVSKKKRAKKDVDDAEQDGGQPRGDFISSLFNHNPDIPQIELDANKEAKAKEVVFSETSLSDGGVHPYIEQTLAGLGMTSLTRVQSLAIPVITAGFDCLIKSQTGSGKTLAYAIPMMQQLASIRPKIQRCQGTFAVVVCPTRELVVQSYEWFVKLCHSFAWIVPGMLIGGEKRKSEKARVRKGMTVLIATPGRLIDHISHTKSLSLDKVCWLVLDECDRMLELGYKRDVEAILAALDEKRDEAGRKRQTVMLSATLTTGIEEMSAVSLKHPRFVDAAVNADKESAEKTVTAPDNLKQAFSVVPAKLRLVALAAFILWKCSFTRKTSRRKLIVFMSTQDMVDFHCELLGRCLHADPDANAEKTGDDGIEWTDEAKKVAGEAAPKKRIERKAGDMTLLKLHGSMEQADRLKILEEVKRLDECVLLCTDVAARGLDLPKVDWIVQYNAPTSTADYVHRIGRTARIGAPGSSLIFVLPSEAGFVKELESANMALAELTAERVLTKLHDGRAGTGRRRTMEETATELQMRFETAIAEDAGLRASAGQAYTSFVRSYASYPKEIRHIFSFKALHLGHLAKSFALRDPPTKITGIGKGHWVKKEARKKNDLRKEHNVIKAQQRRINQKSLVVSEFSSGFDGITFDSKDAKTRQKAT